MNKSDATTYIKSLEEKISRFEKSPYYNTYITILGQVESFNEQLTIKKEKKLVDAIEQEVETGKINLFGSKDEKEFDRCFKYMLECTSMHKILDDLRSKMTPDENKKLDIPLAEKIIRNGK